MYIGVSYVLGSATVVIMCYDKYALPKFLKFRVGLFITLGVSMVVPLVHRSVFMSVGLLDMSFIYRIVLMGAIFIFGALLCVVVRLSLSTSLSVRPRPSVLTSVVARWWWWCGGGGGGVGGGSGGCGDENYDCGGVGCGGISVTSVLFPS